jgi:putative FmdB family regulatory protein
MPLYEYKCDKCGDVIEVRQKFSDEPLLVHEQCGGNLERLISRSAFQLKGSGWYATDYSKSNSAPSKSDSSGSAATSETKSDAKSDTKTDTKSDGKSDAKPAESKPSTTDKSKSD